MRHLCCTVLFATALVAGEATAPPLLSLAMPDVARTAGRLASGPYGKIWALPAVQQLRTGLSTLPEADPALLTVCERLQELRCQLTMAPRLADGTAPGTPVNFSLALRLPPGQDPKTPEEMVSARDGAWWTLGNVAGLGVPALPTGPADADARMVIDLTSVTAAAEARDAVEIGRVLAVLGLGRISIEATAFAGGIRETALIHGSKLPLKPVDTSVLAGMPERPMAIGALGIDGPALIRLVHALAEAGGGSEALKQIESNWQTKAGFGFDELLGALDGTIAVVTTPGMPIPGMVVSLPATPALDRIVARLLDLTQPGAGDGLVAQAASQAVLLPLPRNIPVVAFVRRTPTRWLVGTDQMVGENLSVAKPAQFPVATLWAKADGAVALGWADTKAQVQSLASLLPMAQTMVKDAAMRKTLLLAQGAIFASIPYLPPGVMIARNSPDGLRMEGENGVVTEIMPLSVMAGMTLPAIAMVRESARRANAGSNMRQICMAAIAYSSDFDGAWPKDLDTLVKWSDGELVPKLFQSPGHPEIAKPFLYVRPAANAKAIQPVLVQDPACNRGKGSQVCYADGHIAYVLGTALWNEALRLSVLEKAATTGIETDDWTGLEGQVPSTETQNKALF